MEDVEDFFKETTANYASDQDISEADVYPYSSRYSPSKLSGVKLHQVPRRSLLSLSRLSMIPLGTPAKLAIEAENLSFTESSNPKKRTWAGREEKHTERSTIKALNILTGHPQDLQPFLPEDPEQPEIRTFEPEQENSLDNNEFSYYEKNSILEDDEEDPNPELPGSPIRVDPSVLFGASKDSSQGDSTFVDLGLPSPQADRSLDIERHTTANTDSTVNAETSHLPLDTHDDGAQDQPQPEHNMEDMSFGGDFFDNDDGLEPEQTPEDDNQDFMNINDSANDSNEMEVLQETTEKDSSKKTRGRPKGSGGRQKVKIVPLLPTPSPDGLRRSNRKRIPPLAYWRNERVVYAQSVKLDVDPDSTLVRHVEKFPLREIQEVVTYPEEAPKPKTYRKRKHVKSSLLAHDTKVKNLNDLYEMPNSDEEGAEWYYKKVLEAEVFTSKDTITTTKVACAPQGVQFEKVKIKKNGITENYRIGAIFNEDDEAMAAAYLDLPPNGTKTLHSSRTSLFYFNVVIGKVEVQLNRDKFIAFAGTTFKIPHDNMYAISNIGDMPARLFVVQSVTD